MPRRFETPIVLPVASPSQAYYAAHKQYVDDQVATSATSGHTHSYVPTSQRAPLGGLQTPSYSSSLTLDASLGNSFAISATGPLTLNAPSNGVAGQMILVAVTAASGANRVVTLTGIGLTTGLISPYTVINGKVGFFGLRYTGSAWDLLAQTQEL